VSIPNSPFHHSLLGAYDTVVATDDRFTRMGIEGALATRRSSAASCANVPHKRVIAPLVMPRAGRGIQPTASANRQRVETLAVPLKRLRVGERFTGRRLLPQATCGGPR
jgi:hypothetical protein